MKDGRRTLTLTVTPLRAILALAMVVVVASGAATAFAAIGDGGVVQACYDSGGNVKLTPTLPCPKGFTYVGQIYTKAGADALFLTKTAAGDTYLEKTGSAANSDKLDGLDSSQFMLRTNCVGYPHFAIDWHGCELQSANLDKAGLPNANLRGVNFFTASLSGADLRFADLTEADLTGATLIGAHMSGAKVTGVYWASTTCPDGTISDANGGTCEGHLSPQTSQPSASRQFGESATLASRRTTNIH